MSATSGPGVYFPNLDGLRFVAAALVFFPHIEQFKGWLQAGHLAPLSYPHGLSLLGVVLFFVLSGFLITYLLLHERAVAGGISIRWFYVRRILRIWPLYYLLVVLGLLVLPRVDALAVPGLTDAVGVDFGSKLALHLLLLPQLTTFSFPPIPFLSQAWSIGIEEQFYLAWPWVVRRVRQRLPLVLAAVVAASLGLEVALKQQLAADAIARVPYLSTLLWGFSNFGSMALGGLMACAVFARWERCLALLYQPVTQVTVYAATLACIGVEVQLPYGGLLVYAAAFAVITVNLATNPKSLLRLERAPLRYLGKVSYGIYMYHPLATIAVLVASRPLGVSSNALVIAVSAGGTLLLAALSYELFERPLLRLKRGFTVTPSGDDAARPA